MKPLRLHNEHDRLIHLLLEPSGHCFEMPPGAVFEVVPAAGAALQIHHQDPDLMIEGTVTKVLHNGEELASWGYPSEGSPPKRLADAAQLRAHLMARGEQISATPAGAQVIRGWVGKPVGLRAVWLLEPELVLVQSVPGVNAPPEREAALALELSRINAESAIPGFRIVAGTESSPELKLTYSILLVPDEQGSIASSALDKALAVAFATVVRYRDRLEAVAAGRAEPEVR